MKSSLLSILFLISFCSLSAQMDLEFDDLEFYKDQTFDNNVKTTMLYKSGWQQSDPIIALNSNDRLSLSFDILSDDVDDISFTFIHCNPDWSPSSLSSHEYMPNYQEDNILDYNFSFNTIQKYVNYQLEFPSENMTIGLSGNYIIKVFSTSDPYKVYFTKRFYVYEPKTSIDAVVKQASLSADRYYKHEVDFNFRYQDIDVTDPFSEFEVVLTKNMRWDNAIFDLKPTFIRESELLYQYNIENVFNAGNEYRYFDCRDFGYHSHRTDSIYFENDTNKVVLFSDQKRAFLKYFEQNDYNGKRIIGVENHQAFSTYADYGLVQFNLPLSNVLDDGSIYVFGQFTEFDYLNEAKMHYNYDKKRYECQIFVKQGVYNYQYVYLEGDNKVADESFIEGNHYQTKNSYKVWIYHQGMSDRYYRLIGIKTVNSNQF